MTNQFICVFVCICNFKMQRLHFTKAQTNKYKYPGGQFRKKREKYKKNEKCFIC